jgi:hypothetical protein
MFDGIWAESSVFCDDVNNLLNNVVHARRSQNANRLRSIFGKTLPDFPKEGDVDIVSLTPPCTGFSGLNRYNNSFECHVEA